MQVLANLAGNGGRLFHEAAAMARSELQLTIRRFEFYVAQAEPCHRSSVLSTQIGPIRFVAGISRHAVLLGGKGMHDSRFETGGGKGALGRKVVVSSSFDGDDGVLNIVLCLDLANQIDGQ